MLSADDFDVDEVFWPYVDKEAEPPCWIWTAHRNGAGYGQFHHDGRTIMAHRLSLAIAGREVPDDLTVDHLCRVRHCVNPDHLEMVTMRENILRGEAPSAVNARKTECINGHEYTEANTVWQNGGKWRACRTCRDDRMRVYYQDVLREKRGSSC